MKFIKIIATYPKFWEIAPEGDFKGGWRGGGRFKTDQFLVVKGN